MTERHLPGTSQVRPLADTTVDTFYDVVQPHIEKMTRVAARLAGHSSKDDVVQDALLKAWRHRHQFDLRKGTLGAWLASITAHEASRARGKLSKRPLMMPGLAPRDDVDSLDLASALNKLTERERLAVDLYYYVGLSVTETAAVMRCSPGTVKSTLSVGRAKLRELLR